MTKPCYVYFVGMKSQGRPMPFCKIGLSDNLTARLAQINANNPFDCYVYKSVRCSSRAAAAAIEAVALDAAKRKWRKGEWFSDFPEAIYKTASGLIKDEKPKAEALGTPILRPKLTNKQVNEILLKPRPGGLGESLRLHMEKNRPVQ